MSTTTPNFDFIKPALSDASDITQTNPNWDKVDVELQNVIAHVDNLEDGYIIENIIPYPYFNQTKTLNGVTFTDNGDGTITVNGTNTGDNDADFAIFRGNITLKAGTYVLSGSPEGSSVSTYFLQIADEDWSYSINSYGEKIINVSEDRTVTRIRIVIKPGVTVSSVKFKPMLEIGTIAHEYTPYTKSRQGLREEIANAKDNLFPYPYADKSKTLNGITFVDNGDGTVLANGTATEEATFYISQGMTLKPGIYSFSGCPNAECKIQIASSDWSFNRSDSGKGKTFVLTTTATFSQVRISIPTGVTVSNVIFKPMLVEGDTIPTKHKVHIDVMRKSIAFSCGANTTVLDIVNAYNNKQIGIGERLSLGTYGNVDYAYGYGTLLRAVFDQTLQAYIVKMFIWDDSNEIIGILYAQSADGSMLLQDAEHYAIYHEGYKPYTYGTTDLTAGTSTLDTGKLYFVYE